MLYQKVLTSVPLIFAFAVPLSVFFFRFRLLPNVISPIDFKIFKGDAQIPKWLSPEARSLLRRILDPNPATRITVAGIKADEWFKQNYIPASDPSEEDEEDTYIDDEAFSIHEQVITSNS